MRKIADTLRRLHADDGGSVMIEHALLLAAFTLPMYLVLIAGVRSLGTYYGMLTFFGSIPFF
jgi:Flp pilus assembly pilin Flp